MDIKKELDEDEVITSNPEVLVMKMIENENIVIALDENRQRIKFDAAPVGDGNGLFDAVNEGGTLAVAGFSTIAGLDTAIDLGIQALNIIANASNEFTLNSTGLAIGHDTPTAKLHVKNGDVKVEGLADPNLFFIDRSEDEIGIGVGTTDAKLHLNSSLSSGTGIRVDSTFGTFQFRTLDAGGVTMNDLLTVGLNTQNQAVLFVGNNAAFAGNRFRVDTDGGALDYMINKAGQMNAIAPYSGAGGIGLGMNFATGINGNPYLKVRQQGAENIFGIYRSGEVVPDLFVDAVGNNGFGTITPAFKIDAIGEINTNTAYRVGGVAGLTEVLTFGGGAVGEVATMTFTGGILTARTLVP